MTVTGGAGFIGSHLVDALVGLGARVCVLDSFLTGRRENLAHLQDRIDLVEGDIRDRDSCVRACRDAAVLFHQAAIGSVPRSMRDPATTIDVNVAGTAMVLAVARDEGVRRVVYASSSSVYGDSAATSPTCLTPCGPTSSRREPPGKPAAGPSTWPEGGGRPCWSWRA